MNAIRPFSKPWRSCPRTTAGSSSGEATNAAGFDHPNLVPVYEAGEIGAFGYIVSAYGRGTTLGAWPKQPLRRSP